MMPKQVSLHCANRRKVSTDENAIHDLKERSPMSLNSLEVRGLQWRKATRSVGNGACVEVTSVNGRIAVRDSVNPGGAFLQYPARSWQEFALRVKNENIFE
jgi:hypothetical protein